MPSAPRTRLIDLLVCSVLTILGLLLLMLAVAIPRGQNPSTDRSSVLTVGGVLAAIGLWGLVSCYRNRNAEPLTATQIAAARNDPKRVRLATILCSLAMYGAVLSAMLHPDSLPTSQVVFGQSPLGLPLRAFLVLFFTLLCIPLPVGILHMYRILFRAAAEGGGFSKSDILRSLLRTADSHADLRRSRRIVLGVFAFYVALMAGWIGYAAMRGI